MSTDLAQSVNEAATCLAVSLAGCFLAVPTLALIGFGILAILG